ncbi:hypothetical protein HCA78_05775 [Listeria booriae]|uniref:Uncharacterized protein n=1 Tax=Listeria booriae TaxID=1552123 RepID=A0A842CLW6_9LIST|nr:hypothetical protein [Listeria booriae]MBC2003271.1 hypothetical protein [Listeria booriae]
MNKHAKADHHGFDIDPEQLAHELTMLKLSTMKDEIHAIEEWELYDLYTKFYNTNRVVITEKTRYDSSFKN